MEKRSAPYTSNGPIWTLSLGFAGTAGCGAGSAGVGAVAMRSLPKRWSAPNGYDWFPQQQSFLHKELTVSQSVITFNFIGAAIEKMPSSIPDPKWTAAAFPTWGDTISFPGSDTWFLVHSRHFEIQEDGLAMLTLNLDLPKDLPRT